MFKHKNKKIKVLQSLIIIAAIVVSFLGAGVVVSSSVYADDKPAVPDGCPGSSNSANPTAAQSAVCATIPVGCPGSTKTGDVPPDFIIEKCPYEKAPPPECSAQTSDYNAKCSVGGDCRDSNLDESNCGITRILIQFINILSGIVGVVVVGVLVFSGIQYTTSAGDPQAAAAARKRIINAVLALVFYAMAYGFMQWLVPGGLF